ncbi:protein SPT2 [Hordeum vulgare]|nr:protein SPT2 [Hordeum vulgare]
MSRYEYETNGYHRAVEDEYEDEYYDEDEYEDEGAEAPGEDEEPPEGQQEFLQIRERLKEQIRRKAQSASASTAGRSASSHDRKAPPANFGSFFGPSKPVISQRVIEERKSMKEIQNTVPRERRPPGKDIPSSSKVQAKPNGFHQKQKIVNEAKKKAEALKDNRDYSFLLSDDADIPSPPREKPAARPSLTKKSDREMMHSAGKSRAPISQPARLPNGHGLNNTSSTQRRPESKFESKGKETLPSRERSLDNGRMHSVVRNGSSQTTGSKAAGQKFPSKSQIANKPSMKEVNEQSLRKDHLARKQPVLPNGQPQSSQSQRMQSASYGQRPQQSSQSQRPQQSSQSQRPQQSLQSQRPQQSSQSQRPQQSSQSQRQQQSLQSQRPQQSSQSQRPQQSSQSQRPLQSSQRERPLQSSQRERPLQSSQSQRPQQSSQSQRPQQSLQRQRPQQSSQLQSSQSQRQLTQNNRPQQMLQRQRPLSSQGHYPDQRRVQANGVKPAERQPSRQVSANGIHDDRAKKKQLGKRRFDDDIDDEGDPMAMIRNMFRYDPSKYAGRDDDDSDMEADFATIEMEEKRSARIARKEDEEQLRLLEEEERREQERKRRRVGR